MLRTMRTKVLLLATLSFACSKSNPGESRLRVAAAASLTGAFSEMATTFEAKTKIGVDVIFDSSGKIATQLEQGAPYDVFASANMRFIDQVIAGEAALADDRKVYAVGRLAVWIPEGEPPAELAQLAEPRFEKIALANPKVAPYGAAAKAALEKVGVWDALEPRMIYGKNVRATKEMAAKGNANAALVSLSLVKGEHLLVPSTLHDPLEQGIILSKTSKHRASAAKFVEFVTSSEGEEILRRHGYARP